MASKDVELPQRPVVKFDKVPEQFFKVVNPQAWVNAILYGDTYHEPNPDFISRMLAAESIFAESPEEAFSSLGVHGLQNVLPDTPGATTGPLEITDLYVAASDFETGNPSYVVISAVKLATGEDVKYTTGATNVQATFIGLLRNGVWPIRCQFKRGDSKDKGGKFLIFMLPPD